MNGFVSETIFTTQMLSLQLGQFVPFTGACAVDLAHTGNVLNKSDANGNNNSDSVSHGILLI